LITIEGIVEEIIYSNEINGYTVCGIKYDDTECTAVGYMPFINEGELIKLVGDWITHPDYGVQLKVEAYEKILPKTCDSIERYLASGVIKGLGPVIAKRIIEKFGEDSLTIIHETPESLADIKGISFSKALKIGEAFEEQSGLRDVVLFFQEYGISATYSTKIYKAFGDKTIEEIEKNPYKLADEIFGIGFKKADKIAKSLGIDPKSKYRVISGIKYSLSQGTINGHTYILKDKLKQMTSDLLEVEIADIEEAIASSVFDRSVCIERVGDVDRVYLSAFYYAEIGVARRLFELSRVDFKNNLDDFDEKIEKIQKKEEVLLAEMQRMAIKESLMNGVLVITGGPGTGKTTIIKTIIQLLKDEGFEVVLAAPTGRAAKRMTEATGFESKTIHRLLEIGYMGLSETETVFAKNEENPIESDAIIIDEMSMVDIILMNNLLKAISPGTRLILVGDVDQLPSVGAGNVLKDIISTGVINTVKLTEIYRQAEESMIIVNAHRINKGEKPCLNKIDKDFFLIKRFNGESVVKTIVDLCSKRLPQSYNYDPLKHIQVLSPTRKGIVGVPNLNLELQKILNPKSSLKTEKAFKDYILREGDRVMQIRNNYAINWEMSFDKSIEGIGVFNGDTGIIRNIDNEDQIVEVLFEDDKIVKYDYGNIDEIEPAFAVTVHKSQGSEFPVVVMPIFPGPPMLMTRNLLYTAITRAKSLVVLVGMESTLNQMIENEKETLRNTGLFEKFMNIANY
jgi:exodeoxyribonuclease V alpha subunit